MNIEVAYLDKSHVLVVQPNASRISSFSDALVVSI